MSPSVSARVPAPARAQAFAIVSIEADAAVTGGLDGSGVYDDALAFELSDGELAR